MPDIANGREKVNAFLKEKGIKKTTLAVAYGFKRQEVTNILSGTTKGPRANSFIPPFWFHYSRKGDSKKAPNESQAHIKITN